MKSAVKRRESSQEIFDELAKTLEGLFRQGKLSQLTIDDHLMKLIATNAPGTWKVEYTPSSPTKKE
jgi:hypothetical protein